VGGSLTFFRDQYGASEYSTDDVHLRDIGAWLTTDVQNYAPDCLDLMACVEDVRSGRSATEEWEGNAYYAQFTPGGVTAENLHVEGRTTAYELEEAHSIMRQYLRFLAPTPEDRARALDVWEKENEREHPCRAHL
jgi:hypothetical protein